MTDLYVYTYTHVHKSVHATITKSRKQVEDRLSTEAHPRTHDAYSLPTTTVLVAKLKTTLKSRQKNKTRRRLRTAEYRDAPSGSEVGTTCLAVVAMHGTGDHSADTAKFGDTFQTLQYSYSCCGYSHRVHIIVGAIRVHYESWCIFYENVHDNFFFHESY